MVKNAVQRTVVLCVDWLRRPVCILYNEHLAKKCVFKVETCDIGTVHMMNEGRHIVPLPQNK
jgi:hypothetical protein